MAEKGLIFLILLFISYSFIYPVVYNVQKSDTLWSISKHFDIKPGIITKINDIPDNRIKEGQNLNIPEKIITYTVKHGDNLTQIAREKDSRIEFIVRLNNLENKKIYPGMVIKIPVIKNGLSSDEQAGTKLIKKPINKSSQSEDKKNDEKGIINYKVQKGDSLSSISRKFNVNNHSIMEWNHKNNDSVNIGEKLKILAGNNDFQKERRK